LSTKEFVNRVFSDRQLGEVPGANVARRYGVSTGPCATDRSFACPTCAFVQSPAYAANPNS
tara:strand:+ start:142 stop:324 length:183 start_codon:yes stop_codon:yes gene_type:complete